MRKSISVLLLCLVIPMFSICQDFTLLDSHTSKIKSINADENDYSDLKQLYEVVKDKQIILLGEQEHGDGSAFLAKIRIIKFLHQKLNFDVVAFETGFYETPHYWNRYLNRVLSLNDAIKRALPKQWSTAEEMQTLYQYMADSSLTLTGFDNYDHNATMLVTYLNQIDSLEKTNNLQANDTFKKVVSELFTKGINAKPTKSDQQSFYNHIDLLISTLNRKKDMDHSFWEQELRGLKSHGMGWWQPQAHTRKNWWTSGNIRDKQMAENILWLAQQKYPGRKIVVWAANYHIARNVSTEVKEDKHFQNQGAVAMGQYLHDTLKDKMYALAICSYTGQRADVGTTINVYPIKPRSPESLEHYLHTKTYDYAFVNFSNMNPSGSQFKMAGLWHYELTGNWTKVFDGIFFIDRMQAPNYK